MTEQNNDVHEPEAGQPPEGEKRVTTEEIKVQVEDLFKAINDLIREGTVRRVKIVKDDRILVDVPLWAGIGGGVLMAVYMAPIAALLGVGALVGGLTLRVEREEQA